MTLLEKLWLAASCAWALNLGLLWRALSRLGYRLGMAIGRWQLGQLHTRQRLATLQYRLAVGHCMCASCVARYWDRE